MFFQVRCCRDGVHDPIPERGAHCRPVRGAHEHTICRPDRSTDRPDRSAVRVAHGSAILDTVWRTDTAPDGPADCAANRLADFLSHLVVPHG